MGLMIVRIFGRRLIQGRSSLTLGNVRDSVTPVIKAALLQFSIWVLRQTERIGKRVQIPRGRATVRGT
jgi:hypothetical protein